MREVNLTFHGLGEPHVLVDAEEKQYWWGKDAFVYLLDQVLDRPANADPRISITFDDGNASDARLALPELARRGLIGRFFVCAGRVGKTHYLDQSMIKDLLDGGMIVGSHGMDHRDWRWLDAAQLDIEIGTARRKLEDLTQRNVSAVAIPFGSYDRRVLRRLNQEPWEHIYTSDRGMSRSTSRMKRRDIIKAHMQGRNLLAELTLTPPAHLHLTRAMSRLYKSLR